MHDRTQLPLVVAIGGDPGGANALAPVIATLLADGRAEVALKAYRHAREVFRRHHLAFEEVSENAAPCLPDSTRLVLTSTSVNGLDLEKQFVGAARVRGIPTLVLLDYWARYRERFDAEDGSLVYLPDRIAAMDEQARDELLAVGIDEARIVITGQPAFDDLARRRAAFSPQRRQEVRAELEVAEDETLVVFASQPMAALFGTDASHPGFIGFDEHAVLASLVSALEKVAEESTRKIALVVRPHPRESPASFDHVSSQRIRVRVSTSGDARDLVMAADLVAGMNSVLLVEACYLGCLVASLQPGLLGVDTLPTNRQGVSRAVYSHAEIHPAIRELLFDPIPRGRLWEKLAPFSASGNAARRVADLTYRLLQSTPISFTR